MILAIKKRRKYMFKYSYDALVYYGEKAKDSIERCARYGYDAIELCGNRSITM